MRIYDFDFDHQFIETEKYNKRGGAERILDDMNNGFGRKWLPKWFMMENTVFTKSTYEAVLQFT